MTVDTENHPGEPAPASPPPSPAERLLAWLRRGPLAALDRTPPAAIAVMLIVLVYLWRYATFRGWRVGGDGFYSWIFARSLAFDGDLHLRNDYAVCGDPWHMGVDEGGGRPANPFYLGPALLWAPLLRLVSAVVPLPATATAAHRAGCDGPWAVGTLAFTPLFVGLLLWMGYRVARRFCPRGPAIASMVVVAFCSPLLHFGSLVVSYSHTWAAFGVALAALTFVRAVEAPTSLARWYLAGVGVGVAALMRSQALVLLLAPAVVLLARLVEAARARRWPWRDVAAGLIVLAGCASLFSIQLLAYKTLYGRYWVVPQGRAYLQLAHGHPVLTLFAPRGGFLYWHPLMWLGVIGFGMMLARRATRLVGAALLLPLAIDVYVSASVLDWHGGASFGARRLTTLAAPFVATGGIFLAWLWSWLRKRPVRLATFAAVGWLLPWVVINFGASTANIDDRIAFSRPVPMPELYGHGLKYGLEGVYEAVGNPFVWPASLPFALRYGVHPRRFDVMATGGMFEHSYRPVVRRGPDTIPFNNPAVDGMLVSGLTRTPRGAVVRGGTRARMLTELAWPYVTHVEVSAEPLGPGPVRLTVTSGSFFGRRVLGTAVIPPGGGVVELAAPPGAFDSGVNELLFEPSADVLLRHWRWIDRARHDSSIR